MKIIIFEKDNSFLSKLVSLVTRSKYSHSAVLLNHGSICYFSDSSLAKKGIIITKLKNIPKYLKNRKYIIYDIPTQDKDYKAFIRANELVGKDYDTTGAVLWTFFKLFGITNKNYYCFEYTIEVLKQYYFIEDEISFNPSGDTIIDLATKFGFESRFLNCNKVR